jgi:chromate transporter
MGQFAGSADPPAPTVLEPSRVAPPHAPPDARYNRPVTPSVPPLQEPNPVAPRSLGAVFVAFTGLALQAFGGALAVAQHVLCERRRWLTRLEFIDLLSFGQVLPGPNVCNLSILAGERWFGLRGAVAALGGLVAVPLAIALAVTEVYTRLAANEAVAGAVRGMGAAAIGLIAGTALKLAGALRESPLGVPTAAALGAVAFVLVGILRLPLVAVVVGVGSVAWGLAWLRVGPTPGGSAR